MINKLTVTLVILLFSIESSCTTKVNYIEKTIIGINEGVKLFGKLYTSDSSNSNNSKAVVIFIHGSSPTTTKDRYYNYLMPIFVNNGYAVLLYDKRGNGQSGGSGENHTISDLADDALAMVNSLSSLEQYANLKIGLIGTSQGGWVAPLAASKSNKVSFVVTISGPATSMNEQGYYQRAQEMEEYGMDKNQIQEIITYKKSLNEYFRTGVGYEDIKLLNSKASEKSWFSDLQPFEKNIYPPEVINSHEGFKSFKMPDYNPAPTLEQIQVPFLAIFGSKDRHIPVSESVERIRNIMQEVGNESYFDIKIFKNHGHILQLVEDDKELLTASKNTTPEERTAYMNNFKKSSDFMNFLISWVDKTINTI